MDVARYLAIGRRWWWLLILGVMFSVAAYGIVTRLHGGARERATYASSTTLFVTLPPLPDSALTVDSAKRPWELDRLMATYGQLVRSRTVAQRAISDAQLSDDADDLASRVTGDTFGYTQLLRVTVTAASPGDAERSVSAVVRAFDAVRAEHAIPGDAATYETSPAVRTDRATPEFVNIAIVIFAGLVATAGIVLVFEYVSGGVRETGGPAVHTGRREDGEAVGDPVAATRPLASNERA